MKERQEAIESLYQLQKNFAPELIHSVGMNEAKGMLSRQAFRIGKKFGKSLPVSTNQVGFWEEIGSDFLREFGLQAVQLLAQAQENHDGHRLVFFRVSWIDPELNFSKQLGPWCIAAWLSGFSSALFYKEIYFKVSKAPIAGEPTAIIEGKESVEWPESWQEPLVDHSVVRRFFESSRHPKMRKLLLALQNFAASDCPVFFVGKASDRLEGLARFVHLLSAKMDTPLVFLKPIGLDSQLFDNALQSAEGTTLFVSSVDLLPSSEQLKLIRVINDPQSDVRLILSSQKPIKELYEHGVLLPELVKYFEEFQIEIPSLSERIEDIIPNARHFLKKFSREEERGKIEFAPAVMNEFLHYEWPGGFEELRSVIWGMIERKKNGELKLDVRYLPPSLHRKSAIYDPNDFAINNLADVEKKTILSTLNYVNGNKTEASKILGIGYNTLWRKLKSYNKKKTMAEKAYDAGLMTVPEKPEKSNKL